MSGLFGGSKPKIEKPLPAPTIDDAANARESADALRRRKGRAASIITGSDGADTPKTTAETLLGG